MNRMARACVCIPMTAVMVMVVVMRLMMVTMMQDSGQCVCIRMTVKVVPAQNCPRDRNDSEAG